jgi:hypothetical protein
MSFRSVSTPQCRQTSGARLSRTADLPGSRELRGPHSRYPLLALWLPNRNVWATTATNLSRLVTLGSIGQRRRLHAAACIRRSKRSFQGKNRTVFASIPRPPFVFTVPHRHDSIKARQVSLFRVQCGSYCVVRSHGTKERERVREREREGHGPCAMTVALNRSLSNCDGDRRRRDFVFRRVVRRGPRTQQRRTEQNVDPRINRYD